MKTKSPELNKPTTYSTSVGALGLFLFLLFLPGLRPFSAFSEETEKREKQEIRSDSPETPKIPYSEKELLKTGRPAPYRDEQLREIAFPLGGIGTGTISLGGRGELRDWEIFNRPGKGINLPFTFFAIYGEVDGKKFSRLLEAQLFPPYTGGHGLPRERVPGLPRFQKAVFRAEYPLAEVELSDPSLPVVVTLEAFNPFVPGDAENSGLPVAVLKYRVKNLTDKALKITLAGSLANPVGFDGEGALNSLYHREFGQNVNRLIKGPVSGLYFYSRKVSPDSPAFGTLALATTWPDLTYVTHWVRGEWWDDLQIFWDDFSDDGQLKDLEAEEPSPDGRTDVGTLGLKAIIPAGGEVTLPLVISWHFPNLSNYFDVVREQRGKTFHPYYTRRFQNAWQVVEYLFSHLDQLEKRTGQFREAFFSSTLPFYVLEAVSSQVSTVRTPTCLWLDDGRFFAFEGCNDRSGCCPLNCAHVWNYAQSLAFLFPGLERSMRETDFLVNVKPDGAMVFRTSLPTGEKYWDFKPAADGQLGRLICLYRDWQISGDLNFLKRLWPQAKKALEYAWAAWDKDRDGLLEDEQHNTYDIEFFGPNSMVSSFYLGALKAAAKIALALGEGKAAAEYERVFQLGQKNFDHLLWNGEYYVQNYEKALEKKYQYGEGCLADQLLGQWLSMVAGVGRFLDETRVVKALEAIYRYNFRENFYEFSNAQRTYALADEKGLLLCTWPRGGRPPLPFPYSDEVWTGIEYQVASHLLYEGKIREGLTLVRAARERYDGRRRNPWDEVECGHHYARAMSSWALLLALSGFEYSLPGGRIGFDPLLNQDDFQVFWSLGPGWGIYSQKLESRSFVATLRVEYGQLPVREIFLGVPEDLGSKKILRVEGEISGKKVRIKWKRQGRKLKMSLPTTLTVLPGRELSLRITT